MKWEELDKDIVRTFSVFKVVIASCAPFEIMRSRRLRLDRFLRVLFQPEGCDPFHSPLILFSLICATDLFPNPYSAPFPFAQPSFVVTCNGELCAINLYSVRPRQPPQHSYPTQRILVRMAESLNTTLVYLLDKPTSNTYDHEDLLHFQAILLTHRILRSKNSPLRLNTLSLGKAVSKLLGQNQLLVYSAADIVPLELLLRVTAEAMLSLSNETFTISHKVREVWYVALDYWFDVYLRIVDHESVGLDVERWTVAFHLIHCQSLFLTYKDCYSPTERAVERGEQLADTVLEFYSGQYVRAKEALKKLMHLNRDRVKWHIHFLAFEKDVFTSISASLSGQLDALQLEHAKRVAEKLRDRLDDELPVTAKKYEKAKANFGAVTRHTNRMGPYEENGYYLALGLLDLCYRLALYTSDFGQCFSEIIGAVHSSLYRPSPGSIHHKAIVLYQAICSFEGQDPGTMYGVPADREAIQLWLQQSEYFSDSVRAKATKKYSTSSASTLTSSRFERMENEITKLKESVGALLEG
jgi:hypothetical protein